MEEKKASLRQIEANRRNAQKSTGPRTARGKATVKLNGLKHGLVSKQVLIRGLNGKESSRQFTALHRRFTDSLQPVGPVEEMLVDQIVTTHWRLRRALAAEAGEMALSVDGGQWEREIRDPQLTIIPWDCHNDPIYAMRHSVLGNQLLESHLTKVRRSVEEKGELTEEAIKGVTLYGGPYRLTQDLMELRALLQRMRGGASGEELRAKRKQTALDYLDGQLRDVSWAKDECEEREEKEEEARQAAAVLPSLAVVNKIMRYETMLERQLHRALAQLERLQRLRQGEAVPAPVMVEVGGVEELHRNVE